MRGLLTALSILVLCIGPGPVHAQVRAWLDRAEIALGETVTLNIEVQGAGASAPDFSLLDAEFERRGSSSSSQISLVNGQRSATTLFAVSLQPRREGRISVPPLRVGSETTPALEVRVGPSPIDTGSGGDVFLEATLSSADVYVQQQVIYALKLYYAVSLWDGQLDAPAADGVRSYRLGEDLKYQVERGGRRYSVIERRFALVPERSGEIALPPARFDGTGLDRGGYGGLLGSAGIRLSAAGPALSLQVRARPDGAAEPWLPATTMSLQTTGEVLPDVLRVGEPLSLGVQLRASGLVPAQLPEIELPAIDGAAIYPDQASTRDTSSAEGLAGERFRRFALVPQRAGVLELPALRIPWWDVASDQQRWAELPPRSIRVLPGAATDAAEAAPATASSPPEVTQDDVGAQGPGGAPAPALWMLATALVGTVLGWYLGRRGRDGNVPPARQEHPVRSIPTDSLAEALRSGELPRVAAALRAAAPGPKAISSQLDSPDQRDLAAQLERLLYASSPDVQAAELLAGLRKAFAGGAQWRSKPSSGSGRASPFPPLYG